MKACGFGLSLFLALVSLQSIVAMASENVASTELIVGADGKLQGCSCLIDGKTVVFSPNRSYRYKSDFNSRFYLDAIQAGENQICVMDWEGLYVHVGQSISFAPYRLLIGGTEASEKMFPLNVENTDPLYGRSVRRSKMVKIKRISCNSTLASNLEPDDRPKKEVKGKREVLNLQDFEDLGELNYAGLSQEAEERIATTVGQEQSSEASLTESELVEKSIKAVTESPDEPYSKLQFPIGTFVYLRTKIKRNEEGGGPNALGIPSSAYLGSSTNSQSSKGKTFTVPEKTLCKTISEFTAGGGVYAECSRRVVRRGVLGIPAVGQRKKQDGNVIFDQMSSAGFHKTYRVLLEPNDFYLAWHVLEYQINKRSWFRRR